MANLSKRRRKEFEGTQQTWSDFDSLYGSEKETANRWDLGTSFTANSWKGDR